VTRQRRPTSTSAFGVGRRESHDASTFYDRFPLPEVSAASDVATNPSQLLDVIHVGDSRSMSEIVDSSVALVVTSPPYFAGKEYEEALGQGHVPGTYVEYLEMLADVFAECRRKLEPGGRIAVNVANLGRRPYRSLAADVIGILQDRLNLLLRGEILWVKGRGANGSVAWGSFQSPSNPVIRDLTERVVVASKGRFDRALNRRERKARGLPSEISIFKDEFMLGTTDIWELPPEIATRVNHPAPFPIDLPLRLIELYTYVGDVILDPFMGSGSTAVAAIRSERHFVGYDTEQPYVDQAVRRVELEGERLRILRRDHPRPMRHATPQPEDQTEPSLTRAVRTGASAKEIASAILSDTGFQQIEEGPRLCAGAEVSFAALDLQQGEWLIEVCGTITAGHAGLRRLDNVWKAIGKAALVSADAKRKPLILLTTALPPAGSPADAALQAARGRIFHDAIEMLSSEGHDRLRSYAAGGQRLKPIGDLLTNKVSS
jgi:DNA modification methylase